MSAVAVADHTCRCGTECKCGTICNCESKVAASPSTGSTTKHAGACSCGGTGQGCNCGSTCNCGSHSSACACGGSGKGCTCAPGKCTCGK
ncbi:hypothetical protein SeMB42_g02382 [Synchytrium endobioticum]|uniref:Metallothionein n=1 Tax=Synchytrium endobioticum TaxID=286115 RepID=A0A507DFC5_9FUNG|nr:hypothetical protein SeLEV6574_g02675 [Synchytrium endobioticum]TPX50101.1 hypothetical protein SeMB42_g02382 [Synchytrium endobioticum]